VADKSNGGKVGKRKETSFKWSELSRSQAKQDARRGSAKWPPFKPPKHNVFKDTVDRAIMPDTDTAVEEMMRSKPEKKFRKGGRVKFKK